MTRLLIHVEGQTEEDFVNKVLRDWLVTTGYHSVGARLVGNARLRGRRGGIRKWPSVRTDIANHLREDGNCIATTMVDYYALPQSGPGEWPGRLLANQFRTIEEKAGSVENALRADLNGELGARFDPKRFVPFVLMHEFEGLLFSDCGAFSRGIGRAKLEPFFQKIRDQFGSPEEINDSPETAPSKRVEALVAGYQKPLLGVLAAREIGLARIRQECPHFNGWLKQLELLAKN